MELANWYEPKVGVPCLCAELAPSELRWASNTRCVEVGGVVTPKIVTASNAGDGWYCVYAGSPRLLTVGRRLPPGGEEEAAWRLTGQVSL